MLRNDPLFQRHSLTIEGNHFSGDGTAAYRPYHHKMYGAQFGRQRFEQLGRYWRGGRDHHFSCGRGPNGWVNARKASTPSFKTITPLKSVAPSGPASASRDWLLPTSIFKPGRSALAASRNP